ncbi:hypothetical protein [Flavihumibacter fluvii]|uniref:hypothetical protein n=1 Tax=Flavihumibacter fluvii TaxID=2838157 RepID=UPI001BDE0F41|nr:hypothetical protein [Flavihumibacter fluvii]ULQ53574.1 hypothetical protein KJS93_04470 [Flavihumibacter fluvii]
MEPSNNNHFELVIDEIGKGYLAETAKWAKFLSIMGFMLCGLLLILGLVMGTAMGTMFASSQMGAGKSLIFSVGYILIAALYFLPCLYLYKFSRSMQVALKAGDLVQLDEGLKNLKSCFKFMGVLTIILLSLYGIAFLVGGIAAAFSVN